jgi:hypothetical protein
MKNAPHMNSSIAITALAIGLIFGCTPRDQANVSHDSVAVTTTTTTSTSETAPVAQSPSVTTTDTVKKGSSQDPKKPNSPTTKNSDNKMMRKSITNVLEANTHMWMEIPGVNGTGEGQDPNGNPAIIIFTDRDASEIQSKLPSEKDGYPIIIREIGVVKPMKLESN